MIGAPRHVAVELGEGDDRAGKGDGADGDAQAHLDQALGADGAFRADAEGVGRIKRRAPRSSTAARPTSEWNAATSCGMSVMAMRLRHHRADAAADGDARRRSGPRSADR